MNILASNILVSNLFQPGCPWYDLNFRFPPNINWCEEKICSFILTPFNTWSNLGYLGVGIYLWFKNRRSNEPLLRFFGPSLTIVGISSFVYHMSLNLFTQVFDFFGMYVFCVLLLMFNLSRGNRWPAPPRAFIQFWWVTISLTLITVVSYFIRFPIQAFVFFLILGIIYTEFKVTAPTRKYFWLTVGLLAAASVFSILDHSGIICQAQNHYFQGHGMFHLLGAAALLAAHEHYARLNLKPTPHGTTAQK